MKEVLLKRMTELAVSIEQMVQNLNTMRGQKMEAEAMFQHLQREEAIAAHAAAEAAKDVTPVEPPPQAESAT